MSAPATPVGQEQPRLVPIARYDGAGHGRRMRGWIAPSTGPNSALSPALTTLRNRCRDAVRNDPHAAAAIDRLVASIVGCGIIPRPKTTDTKRKAELQAAWDAWVRESDADGQLDFYGLQSLALRSMLESGEVFVRLRLRDARSALTVPLQIQIQEADMVPLGYNREFADGTRIIDGIELDKYGRRLAYHMYRAHPGDRNGGIDVASLLRIPADQVLHLFEPVRPGQLRGAPALAPVLAKLRSLGDFDDAVLERQKLANLFTLFVTRPSPTAEVAGIDPTTGQAVAGYDAAGAPLVGLEPGTAQELMPGEDVRFSEPPDAGANYGEFMTRQLASIATALGLPAPLLSGDLSDVSDRTLRIAMNEFRRRCEQRQWLLLIPQFLQPVRDLWQEMAVMSGAVSIRAGEVPVIWSPPAWPRLHPTQDVQAEQMEVDAGFRSRSSVIAERGFDAEEVDGERMADQAREARLGIERVAPRPASTFNTNPGAAEEQP